VEVKRGVATIHDPAHGRLRLRLDEVSRHFTGVVLELSPAASFVPRDERRRVTLRQLLGQVSGFRRSATQILLLALALEFFVLLSPFFMQFVVDDVLVSGDRDWLVTLGIGPLLVLIQTATAAARVAMVLATLNLHWYRMMRLPVAWFEKRHAGDIWSRFGSVQQIQKTLTTSFIEAVLDGLLVVLTLAMMWVYSSLTAVAAAVAVCVAVGLACPAAQRHRGGVPAPASSAARARSPSAPRASAAWSSTR
jgi:ATP-binding cassette subfamily B protein RaxB